MGGGRSPLRQWRAPSPYTNQYVLLTVEDEQDCYEEAMADERNEKWQSAMDEEMQALIENNTCSLVPRVEEKQPIGCKWIYKIKRNVYGSIARYKARIVAKGYAKKYGIDYEETFSLVVKNTTIRVLITLAVSKRWSLYQLDVKNAFLNAELEEEVYIEQPQGYMHKQYPNYVCKLKKALSRLKQAPRAWNHKLIEYLVKCDFIVSDSDSSLYIKHNGNHIVLLCIYVDDLILTGSCGKDIKDRLKKEFKISDLGELRYFLGIEIIITNEVM